MNNVVNGEENLAIEAIRRKLVGKKLTYKEIFAVMDEIAHNRFGDILTTYFAASGYSKGFTNEELFFLTRAMVDTGEKLHFKGIVADKHSIGGVPGTRTTLIVVPIVAAAGFTIPKSSSRAITTPDGTADDMEVLSRVEFSKEEVETIVQKVNACIVWGGSFHIAPADDILIHVEKPLMFESFDKIVVSIMAKKIAFGSNHVVIDLPFGYSMKVHSRNDALVLKEKFEYVAKKFGIKIKVLVHETNQPSGRGIGPVLETRESIRVLEQVPDRPLDLEEHALFLSGHLLNLCLASSPESLQKKIREEYGSGYNFAKYLLSTGRAWEKMKQIIAAQGGNPHISSAKLSLNLGSHSIDIVSPKRAIVKTINSKHATSIAKILGAPGHKGAGIYFHKKIGDIAKKGEALYTLYSENVYNLSEARASLKELPILGL